MRDALNIGCAEVDAADTDQPAFIYVNENNCLQNTFTRYR